jgi:phosphatidylglycerol:prolipoprotein diacylglycerol transferase
MLSAALWTGDVQRVAFIVFGRPVAWYGIIITFGMLVGLILAIYRTRKIKMDSGDVMELFIFVIPFAIVFARLGFVVFRPEFFPKHFTWSDFVDIIAVWDGGLTILTGIPGGVLGAFLWCKLRKHDFINVSDRIAPVVLVSQAIGRWGNFFNQEIYGQPITNPDWQFFPVAVYIRDRAGYFQATFFYEMVLNLLFFAMLVIVLKRLRVKGAGILGYLFSYTLIRFIMEFMRDDLGFYKGVNFAQIICICVASLCLAAILVMTIVRIKKGEKVWYRKGIPDDKMPSAKISKAETKHKSEVSKTHSVNTQTGIDKYTFPDRGKHKKQK